MDPGSDRNDDSQKDDRNRMSIDDENELRNKLVNSVRGESQSNPTPLGILNMDNLQSQAQSSSRGLNEGGYGFQEASSDEVASGKMQNAFYNRPADPPASRRDSVPYSGSARFKNAQEVSRRISAISQKHDEEFQKEMEKEREREERERISSVGGASSQHPHLNITNASGVVGSGNAHIDRPELLLDEERPQGSSLPPQQGKGTENSREKVNLHNFNKDDLPFKRDSLSGSGWDVSNPNSKSAAAANNAQSKLKTSDEKKKEEKEEEEDNLKVTPTDDQQQQQQLQRANSYNPGPRAKSTGAGVLKAEDEEINVIQEVSERGSAFSFGGNNGERSNRQSQSNQQRNDRSQQQQPVNATGLAASPVEPIASRDQGREGLNPLNRLSNLNFGDGGRPSNINTSNQNLNQPTFQGFPRMTEGGPSSIPPSQVLNQSQQAQSQQGGGFVGLVQQQQQVQQQQGNQQQQQQGGNQAGYDSDNSRSIPTPGPNLAPVPVSNPPTPRSAGGSVVGSMVSFVAPDDRIDNQDNQGASNLSQGAASSRGNANNQDRNNNHLSHRESNAPVSSSVQPSVQPLSHRSAQQLNARIPDGLDEIGNSTKKP